MREAGTGMLAGAMDAAHVMVTPGFEISITPSPSAVRPALDDIIAGHRRLCLQADELDVLRLVLAEVLNNVMEHALRLQDGCRDIRIATRQEPDGLHVCVIDGGGPMPEGQIPPGAPPDINVELSALPEGGFGWFLIRDLTRDLRYARKESENHLEFRLALGVGKQG